MLPFVVGGMERDPFWQDVILINGYPGADASIAFADESLDNRTITRNGDVEIDTAQSKFGGSSGLFQGSDDFLTVAGSSDFEITTSTAACLETFFRPSSLASGATIFGSTEFFNSSGSKTFIVRVRTDGEIEFVRYEGTTNVENTTTSGASVSTGSWYHVAVDFSGSSGAFKIFVDEVERASGTIGYTICDSTQGIIFGASGTTGSNYADDYTGWIDESRITLASRYYANGVPPIVKAFPRI